MRVAVANKSGHVREIVAMSVLVLGVMVEFGVGVAIVVMAYQQLSTLFP